MCIDARRTPRWTHALLALGAAFYSLHCATPDLSQGLPTSPDDAPPATSTPVEESPEIAPSGGSTLEPAPSGDDESGGASSAPDAGSCVSDEGCSAASVGKSRCAATGGAAVLRCAKEGDCFKWTPATSCTASQKCEAGACVNACNTCTLYATRCVAGMARSRQICVVGSTGCTVWATGQSCAPDSTCVAGACN